MHLHGRRGTITADIYYGSEQVHNPTHNSQGNAVGWGPPAHLPIQRRQMDDSTDRDAQT